MKLGAVGVNLGNVEAYRTALKGLSVEQSVFALASKGATDEQIRQILVTDQAKLKDIEAAMAKAGLTTATKALNAEELIALATKKGISAERAKEIASALGLIATEKGQVVSKKQLTVATLQQVGATDAEITAILGLNAAETANIGITNVLTASFAKLWAVITAHPIGAILTAIGVVAVSAVAAYNKWGDTLENTKEKLSDLKSECQEIVSDLQAVNSELETTQQRLEELEGKDTLTFTEKEEYDNLVKINNELQRKIDLLELEEKNKRKEQNKTFVSAMEKDTEDPFEHEVNPDGKKPTGQYSISDEYLTSETGYIEAQFEIRDQLLEDLANAETEKEKERIQKRIDEIDKYLNDKNDEWKNVSDGIDYIENPTTEDDKAVNEWLDYIADFQDRMAIAMSKDDASSNAQYKTNTFNRVVDNWQFDETVQGLQDLGKEGKVTAEMLDDPKYDDFINKLVFLGVIDSADNLEDVALAFNSVATSAENAADSASKYTDETDILSISKTIDQLNTRLKPSMDSLKSAWQDIFTDDGFSLDNIDLLSTVDSIKSKLDELNKIDGITVDYSSFEDFVRILENTESTEEDVKQGFNELASSIVQASVSGIEDFQTLKEVLEDLGVVNNDIVAFEALAQNIDALKSSGLDLLNATQFSIKAFASERVSAENLSEAIAFLTKQQEYLRLQKEFNSLQDMDSSQEISNLKKLAESAGITGDIISELTELEQIYQAVASGVYGTNNQQVAMAMERARQLQKKISEGISEINLKPTEVEIEYAPKIDKSSAEKSAKDLEKLTKDYVDAYMTYMEQSLKTGRIDYQTYSRDVAKFLKDMYDQGKIAAKDYHDYTKQMLEMEKSIYDAALSAINDLLDDEIDKIEDSIDAVEKQNDALEEQKTLMENAASAVVDYIDSLIDGENEAIDALNKANDGIQEQIDKYDSLVNVADRLYESEQNRLKDEQDAIQEKIDLLQEENDQKDLQYRKEQALYELQRSQEQRTKKVYVGGDKGYVYDTDKSAISDAKKNLQDIETEELISSLEKEKDALQGSIDALQEYRDTLSDISDAYQKLVDERNAIELIGENYEDVILGMNINDWILLKDKYIFANNEMADNENIIKSHDENIKIWEEEKRKWGNLSSVIDTESKKQAAIQKFGADWQEKINNNRLISFDEFKEQYLNIDSQINDNNTLINSYNEKIRYYESLKKQWSSITSVYEDEMNKQYAAQLLGLNWESDVLNGRLGTLDNFKNQYISIQQQIADAAWKSANEQVRAAQEAAKGADGNINDNSTNIESELDKNKDANSRFNITYGDLSGFKQKLNDVEKYGASAVIAPKINNNTQNTNNNTGILDKYYKKLKRGSKYASGTKNAKKGLNLVGEDGVETYIDNNGNVSLVTEPTLIPMEGGEIVKNESETKSLLNDSNLVPLQTSDLFKKLSVNMPDLSSMFKTNIPDYSNLVMRNNNVQQPSIVIGDIHLHEVQNVPDFAKALQKHLPNISVQYNGKH